MIDFIKTNVCIWTVIKGSILFAPSFIGYLAGIISSENSKKKLLKVFFNEKSKTQLYQMGNKSFEKHKNNVDPFYLSKLIEHKAFKDKIVIVSASCSIWLQPWADHLNTDLICTEVEFDKDEIFRGNFSTLNCNYDQKVIRIKEKYDLSQYDIKGIYGNGKGDEAMMNLKNLTW